MVFTNPGPGQWFAGTDLAAPIPVAGAHIDTLNQSDPSSGATPEYPEPHSGHFVRYILLEMPMVPGPSKPNRDSPGACFRDVKSSSPVEFHWHFRGGGRRDFRRLFLKWGTKRAMVTLDRDPTGFYLLPSQLCTLLDLKPQPSSPPQIGPIDGQADALITAFTNVSVFVYREWVLPLDCYVTH